MSSNPAHDQGVLDTWLCDKVCHWLATGRWFSPGALVSSTNKSDHHDITEMLLKVALNTTNQSTILTLFRFLFRDQYKIYRFNCLWYCSQCMYDSMIMNSNLFWPLDHNQACKCQLGVWQSTGITIGFFCDPWTDQRNTIFPRVISIVICIGVMTYVSCQPQ